MKTCSKCNTPKDLTEFCKSPRNSQGVGAWCKPCNAQYRKDNHANIRAYFLANRTKIDANVKRCVANARDVVIDGYGAVCTCCGQTRRNFLSLEHVNGGGREHRKACGSPYNFWKSIAREGFPDKYTILCFNCNLSRGFYGYCCNAPQATPHL